MQENLFDIDFYNQFSQYKPGMWGNHTGLLNPYPGSKRIFSKYPIWDGDLYDAVVEPCVGSGHFTTWMISQQHTQNAFVADSNPGVNYMWRHWYASHDHREKLQNSINNFVENHIEGKSFDQAKEAYDWIKATIEDYPGESINTIDFLTAFVLIRRLSFGSYVRNNAQGKLNVSLHSDKLESMQGGWRFQWPWLPSSAKITIADDASKVIMRFNRSGLKKAIALFDPPYWVPYISGSARRGTGGMTAAYQEHSPHDPKLFEFTQKVLSRLIKNPRIHRIVFTNYISEPMNDMVKSLCQKHDRDFLFTDLGPLQRSNNYAETRTDPYHEGFWEIGGTFMKDRYINSEINYQFK